MMDRRLIENFDWGIIWVLLCIITIGLLSVYSALYPQILADPARNQFVRQVIWLAVGFAVLFLTLTVDYQQARRVSTWIYLASLLMLIAVLVVGKEVNGSKRWFDLLGFRFQPSEFMKIAIVLQLGSYFSSSDISPYPPLRDLLLPGLMLAAPVLLILAQPDLGTAISVISIAGTMVFFMGIRWRYILAAILCIAPMVLPIWEHVLKK